MCWLAWTSSFFRLKYSPSFVGCGLYSTQTYLFLPILYLNIGNYKLIRQLNWKSFTVCCVWFGFVSLCFFTLSVLFFLSFVCSFVLFLSGSVYGLTKKNAFATHSIILLNNFQGNFQVNIQTAFAVRSMHKSRRL